MNLRIVLILLLCFVVINLFVGLFHIVRGKSTDNRVVRSLTIRVAASVILFGIILLAVYFRSPSS